jgi:hypothetical protein
VQFLVAWLVSPHFPPDHKQRDSYPDDDAKQRRPAEDDRLPQSYPGAEHDEPGARSFQFLRT